MTALWALWKRGVVIIRAEEVAACADQCSITIRGIKLPNKDGLFGKSDPFFTISRLREDNEWQQVITQKQRTQKNNQLRAT